jgi:hypothetical protein
MSVAAASTPTRGTIAMLRSRHPRAFARAGLCVLAVAALHAPTVLAAERTINVSATGICDAPLPVFNAELRRRPVAVQNESTRPVFVTCTLPTDREGQSATGKVRVGFRASGPAATISCTMVSGTDAVTYYVVEDVQIAGGGQASVFWEDIDKWSSSGTYSFSCNLPAGVAMDTISYTQTGIQGRI